MYFNQQILILGKIRLMVEHLISNKIYSSFSSCSFLVRRLLRAVQMSLSSFSSLLGVLVWLSSAMILSDSDDFCPADGLTSGNF